jgi:hypothetical protein
MFISFLRGMGPDLNQVLSEQGAVRPHTDPTVFKSHFRDRTVLHLEQCGNGERSVPASTHVTLPYGLS